ncbi:MAG: hypothetical protein VKP57_01020 [Candidatus Sericytochromatia bacterium]|nr:hypothetical protein [Candidatus Sericytochromatia bacterium]
MADRQIPENPVFAGVKSSDDWPCQSLVPGLVPEEIVVQDLLATSPLSTPCKAPAPPVPLGELARLVRDGVPPSTLVGYCVSLPELPEVGPVLFWFRNLEDLAEACRTTVSFMDPAEQPARLAVLERWLREERLETLGDPAALRTLRRVTGWEEIPEWIGTLDDLMIGMTPLALRLRREFLKAWDVPEGSDPGIIPFRQWQAFAAYAGEWGF